MGTWLALFTTQIDRCLKVLNGRMEQDREEEAGVSVMEEVHGWLQRADDLSPEGIWGLFPSQHLLGRKVRKPNKNKEVGREERTPTHNPSTGGDVCVSPTPGRPWTGT